MSNSNRCSVCGMGPESQRDCTACEYCDADICEDDYKLENTHCMGIKIGTVALCSACIKNRDVVGDLCKQQMCDESAKCYKGGYHPCYRCYYGNLCDYIDGFDDDCWGDDDNYIKYLCCSCLEEDNIKRDYYTKCAIK